MMKILESRLKQDQKLCESLQLERIINGISLPDLRTIRGKPIIR